MDIKVLDADFYFIAPIIINDMEAFEREFESLPEKKKWERKSNTNKDSIKDFVSCFLGEVESASFPMDKGVAYKGLLQNSGKKAMNLLNGNKLQFRLNSGKGEKPLIAGKEVLFVLESNSVTMHISPNRKNALAYIQLRCESEITLDEAIAINYHLHKIKGVQTPRLYVNGRDGELVSEDGIRSIPEIITGMLPETGYDLSKEARLVPSVYLRLDTSGNPKEEEIAKALARAGEAKGEKYNITKESVARVKRLFDDIWTYTSTEGFATFVLANENTDGMDADGIKEKRSNESFKRQFKGGPFKNSYMPIYLTALLADNCLENALRHLNRIAMDVDEQDRLREIKMVYSFEPSNYTHLNALMQGIKEERHFDLKYDMVMASIEARRIRNESERNRLEEEARKLEEEERAKEEEHMKEQEKIRAKRHRNIERLLGFMGAAQVMLAILQLWGAEKILVDFGSGPHIGLMVFSWVVVVIFSGVILWLIWYLFKEWRKYD